MSPLKLVPARRRAQDARGHEAERPRAGRPQNRKNDPQSGSQAQPRTQPRTQPRLQPREKAQEKAQGRAPAAASSEIPPEGERLNKHLARTGVCSRREADDWISQGWVRINGRPVEMGQKVMPGDVVEVRQAARARQQDKVTILLNKPVGYVSGQAEDGYRPAVTLIDAQSRWAGDTNPRRFERSQLRGLAVAGRLDIDSVGLLVLTQDGRVARQLIGEDSTTTKEYLVRVRYGAVERNVQAAFPPERLKLLRHGLSLDGHKLKPAQVDWENPEQLRFVLQEGRHRQIRRMCELVGLAVTGLKRIRVGNVLLGRLPPGQWRYLGLDESF